MPNGSVASCSHQHCVVLWFVLVEKQWWCVQRAILAASTNVGRVASADSTAVLALIEAAPQAAAPTVRAFVEGLIASLRGVPPPPLVEAAVSQYGRSGDVELLALVLPGLPEEQARAHSTALVQLCTSAPDRFLAAVARLVTAQDGQQAPALAPNALLMHLHIVRPEDEQVRLRGKLDLCSCVMIRLRQRVLSWLLRSVHCPGSCVPKYFLVAL